MLYIVLANDRELTWHVGQNHRDYAINEVTEVQADGDELTHVLTNFHLLRTVNRTVNRRRVVRWFGDDAKFIAGNL